MRHWFSSGVILAAVVSVIGAIPLSGWAAPSGQQATCKGGPRHRTFTLPVIEQAVELGEGLKVHAWTFSGSVPGPVIEVCEGDRVTLVVPNRGKVAHGLDSHALRIDAAKFGPVEAGKTLTIDRVVDTPGVFMYHCAAGPVTDEHIKMGMYGVMIVYARAGRLRPARELVVTQGGIYGEPDAQGLISPDTERMRRNDPFFHVFDGRLTHEPVKVKAGELVRVYFVNIGPGVAAFHVIGTILERAYEGGHPRNALRDIQTYGVPAGTGAMFEFRIPEKGTYLLVDHNLLSRVPEGLVIPFAAE